MERKKNFFRRPEEPADYKPGQVIKAKPIAEHLAKRLGIAGGRDFVQVILTFFKWQKFALWSFDGDERWRTSDCHLHFQ